MDKSQKYEKMRNRKAELMQQQASAPETVEAGRVIFSGPVFNGVHVVRVLSVGDGRPTLDIEVDGIFRGCRTARGMKAALVRKITRRCGYFRSNSLKA